VAGVLRGRAITTSERTWPEASSSNQQRARAKALSKTASTCGGLPAWPSSTNRSSTRAGPASLGGNVTTAVREVVRLARGSALLHPLPAFAVENRRMLARIALPLVTNLTEVDRIGQQLVQRAAIKAMAA
jgi:hypothetical protein